MDKKIKLLMILSGLNFGGIKSYAINYYNELKDKVKIDFIVNGVTDYKTAKEIEQHGDNIYVFPTISLKNWINLYKKLDKFFKNSKYDIIHCNPSNMAFIYFHFAKKYNIKVRILHSHQNKYSDNILHSIRNYPLVKIGKKMTTNRIACSELAGKFLFKNEKFDIINNAINVEKFIYNEQTRNKIKAKLGIQNEFVIGNVGRLTAQKNQKFLIEIYNEIYKINKESVLLIIGNGRLEQKLKKQVQKLKIEKNVIFLSEISNINEYYQAMDVFVLPSIYEGVGIVNIEAQASGLITIVSDVVPDEANIVNENFITIPLEKSAEYWATEILKFNNNYKRKNKNEIVKEKGYNIHEQAEKLKKLYIKYITENTGGQNE